MSVYMKKNISLLFLLMYCFTSAQTVQSPSKNLQLNFKLSKEGIPVYSLLYKNKEVVKESSLGMILKDQPALTTGFVINNYQQRAFNESWKPVLGEQASIRNNYKELKIMLNQKATERIIILVFRVFDDGIAFRYEFPEQENLNYFVISEELTTFNMNGDHKIFWLPGDFDSQEYNFNESLISEINTKKLNLNNGIGFKGEIGEDRIQSPLMMKTADGLYINIFEAAVINYPVMHLNVDRKTNSFTSALTPNVYGEKAILQTSCVTPWRTIMVSDDARDIVGSKMILNLNEPSKIEDTSWIKPMKYIGVWWEMHINKGTWNYANKENKDPKKLIPNHKHAATTENTKRYIDFAAKNGLDGVLVEGWNIGWEDWRGDWRKEDIFDFVTAYPDFDVKELSAYAKAKKVQLIMHHETSASVSNYERRLDRAFGFMKENGYNTVKTGYVGKIIPKGEMHDGQVMVNHFHYVVERAAERKIMVNSHESSRPTGVHRTYPNYIAAEAARGNEFNAWSIGNPPAHETILPFTRLLGGPMDYTPGIFEIKMNHYDKAKKEQVHSTLAKQLALYVTLYSPLQMAADLPENYERYSDAFQFIREVGLDWDATVIVEAEPGDYITIARKEKGKESWFLGAITDENARKTEIELDFLTPNKKYKAVIYEDGKDADWAKNPKSYRIRTVEVTSKNKLKLNLAPGGGTAISFFPAD